MNFPTFAPNWGATSRQPMPKNTFAMEVLKLTGLRLARMLWHKLAVLL